MSHDMSTFFTGVRRNPPDRVAMRTRTGARPGAGAGAAGGAASARGGGASAAGGGSPPARRNRRQQGAGAAGAPRAAGAARASGASGAVPRRPMTRLTGGGLPTASYQSTATSNQRRQQLANPPPRTTHVPRRFREIEWIMKPSKNFVQCSVSSSEDVPKASEMQQLHGDEEKEEKEEKRAAPTTSDSSTSSSGNRNARLQSLQPQQQLENLHPLTIREQEEQVSHLARARTRASRVFCVPSQRIMHVEELKQAQLRQMQPRKMNSRSPTRSVKGLIPERKMKSPSRSPSRSPTRSVKGLIPDKKMKSRSPSRSPTRSLRGLNPERKMESRSPSRSPTRSLKAPSPERKMKSRSPSRSPTRSLKASSPERKMKSPSRSPTESRIGSPIRASPQLPPRPPFLCRKISARSLDGLPVRVTRTVMRLPRPSDKAPAANATTSPYVSPNATPKPSQVQVQEASTSQSQAAVKAELPPSWPCTRPPSPHPSSSSNSSLSTSGTECSCERDAPDPPYRPMPGTRAIKLTSTVIKIMPDRRSSSHVSKRGKIKHHSRCKLKAKSHSTFRVGGGSKKEAPKLAMPTPMIQPISVFRVGGATRSPTIKLAMNGPMAQAIAPPKVISMVAPLIQSMAPPKHVPKVKVSKPMVSQSVHHVVNQFTDKLTTSKPKVNQSVSRVVSQLTAQLKEAAMIRSFDLPDKNLGLGQASTPRSHPRPLDVGRDTRSLSRKTSFYLVMDQANHNQFKPKEASSKLDYVIQNMEKVKEQLTADQRAQQQRVPSGSERKNPYLSDSQDQVRHNYDIYLKNHPKRDQGKPPPYMQTPSGGQPRNPYLNPSEWSRVHSQRTSQVLMSRPVSVNRIPKPRVSAMVPPPPQNPQQQQPQEEPLTLAGGKIVRKAQHKVPRTMEDGIDMSYQYFVSIPLKRGKKPQVVRYLYRPMVRQLNPSAQHSPSRRSSKRAKRRKAAAAASAAEAAATAAAEAGVDPLSQPELEKIDPDLAALGGAPLPLGDPPTIKEEVEEEPPREPKPEEIPTVLFDPEAALNSPYKVPPLKLKSRYMPLLEELEQMPYPEERAPPSRKRRPRRQARAVGGSELNPSTEYEDQSKLGIGGGDDHHIARTDQRRHKAGGASAGPPKRRPALVNYQAKPTCLGTATGVPISYHQPMFITHKLASEDEPMIQTITYEHIQREEMEKAELEREQREREQQEKDEQLRVQMEMDRLEREQLERQLKLELELEEQRQKAKSVSFHPLPVFASRESTSEPSSSSISVSSSHSSSITVVVASSSRSPKAKSKKRKGKKKGKGKGKGRN